MDRRIELVREELLYKIGNYAWIEGHIMGEGTEEARHMTKDACEEENSERVLERLNLSHAQVVEMLYPFTRREVKSSRVHSDTAPESYVIEMSLPTGFSESTAVLIENLIKEYMVCDAVADWLYITNPEKAPVWERKAEMAKGELLSVKNHRSGRKRRTLHPF